MTLRENVVHEDGANDEFLVLTTTLKGTTGLVD